MRQTLRISEAASIALHAMTLMAARPERLRSAHEIAESLRVSEAHLAKVLQRLARSGLVSAVRGPRGGYRLSGPGGKITLLEIVEAVEGRFSPSTCLMSVKSCRGAGCILGDLVGRLNAEVRAHLGKTKLAQLAKVYS